MPVYSGQSMEVDFTGNVLEERRYFSLDYFNSFIVMRYHCAVSMCRAELLSIKG